MVLFNTIQICNAKKHLRGQRKQYGCIESTSKIMKMNCLGLNIRPRRRYKQTLKHCNIRRDLDHTIACFGLSLLIVMAIINRPYFFMEK